MLAKGAMLAALVDPKVSLSPQTGRAEAMALFPPCPPWQWPWALPSLGQSRGNPSKWLFALEPVCQHLCQREPETEFVSPWVASY